MYLSMWILWGSIGWPKELWQRNGLSDSPPLHESHHVLSESHLKRSIFLPFVMSEWWQKESIVWSNSPLSQCWGWPWWAGFTLTVAWQVYAEWQWYLHVLATHWLSVLGSSHPETHKYQYVKYIINHNSINNYHQLEINVSINKRIVFYRE